MRTVQIRYNSNIVDQAYSKNEFSFVCPFISESKNTFGGETPDYNPERTDWAKLAVTK